MSESESLFERAKRVAPGGVHSPVRGFRGVGGTPRFIKEARGAELLDVDGNRYVDYCMSWGPLILGHQDPEVADAVRGAISRGWSYGAAEPYSLELAELITGALPWVQKIRFVNSGTEAVMSALRVARAATGRNKILKFDGCYHGHADSMLVRAGSGLAEMASPDSAGVSPSTAAETVVVPLDDLAAVKQAFELHEIAAVIVEPVPANNGLLTQKDEFLPELCRLAKSAGALVIFDEVITGFRVAFGGMAERTGLKPDLVTYGKIIGGGFPVGAFGGRAELMDLVAPAGPVYQAGTLSANPVAMTAGLATLKKLKRDNPYAALEAKTGKLARAIEKVSPGVRVQNFASLFWGVFGAKEAIRVPSKTPPEQKERFAKLFHGLLQKGVYLAPSGYEVAFLSTAHTDAHLDELARKIGELSPVSLFKAAIRRENDARPPVWFMRQAGRYHSHYQMLRQENSFLDVCRKPEVAMEAALGPVRDFDFDAAILFSDLLFPLEALGMGLSYPTSGPVLSWHLQSTNELRRLHGDASGLEFQAEALRKTRWALPREKGLIGFVGGPLTLYFYAVEGSHKGELKRARAGLRDGLFYGFCSRLQDVLAENMILQARAGADTIAVLDTCAGEVPVEEYRELVVPELRSVLERFKQACPETPVTYYSKGTGPEYWDALEGLPISCLGVDWHHDIREVLMRFGDRYAIQGNVDPEWLLLETAELEKRLRAYFEPITALPRRALRGWICGLGHGVLPKTPEDNVRLFIRLQHEYFGK